jgi:hypothetical protein
VSQLNRGSFLRHAALYGGGAVLAPSLAGLAACADQARLGGPAVRRADLGSGGYGPLASSRDCPEPALPAGFRSVKLSQAGMLMSDGVTTPNAFDGMAAIAGPGGSVRLVRNHEIRDNPANSIVIGDPAPAYDARAGGGTTTLEVRVRPDGTPELVREFASVNDTIVNCAGGPTPWGSWLTCEEATAGALQGWSREHGYVFDVPAGADGLTPARPLRALGRFVHEAIAVDPASGIVYLTEDRSFVTGSASSPGSGFYGFLPDCPGDLSAGRLQAPALKDRATAASDPAAVFREGLSKGATIFQRLAGTVTGASFQRDVGGRRPSGTSVAVPPARDLGRSADPRLRVTVTRRARCARQHRRHAARGSDPLRGGRRRAVAPRADPARRHLRFRPQPRQRSTMGVKLR